MWVFLWCNNIPNHGCTDYAGRIFERSVPPGPLPAGTGPPWKRAGATIIGTSATSASIIASINATTSTRLTTADAITTGEWGTYELFRCTQQSGDSHAC